MSDNKMPDQIPLLLFAKAPIAGEVKTRLMTDCSAHQAAKIAEILIDQSLKAATQYWPSEVVLSVAQQQDHEFINQMLQKYQVDLLPQVAGNLGEKMQSAFETVGHPAAILGCDAPLFDVNSIAQTYEHLRAGRNVIGPSEDGGYYLIGLSEPAPNLFADINWGQSSVFSSTLKAAVESGVELMKIPQSFDIDRWTDVHRAAKRIPELKDYLSAEGLAH